MNEIWKDVDGYEGLYQVSDLGRVKGKDIKAKNLCQGYHHVGLWKNNEVKSMKVHRLVALAFIPNPENKPCINHKDGNKLNNHVNNLEWCTYSENLKHAYDTGLMKAAWKGIFGKDNFRSMPIYQIDPNTDGIIAEYSAAMEAARETGIPQGNITKVCNGKRNIAGGYKWKFKGL